MLTLVKQLSAWVITSKTLPTTPKGQPLVKLGQILSNPRQTPTLNPWTSMATLGL
jgi:hypothetical protein